MRGMKIKMTRETKKLFKVKRKITPLTVLVPLLLVVLLVCAVIYDNSRIVLDEVTFSMPTLPRDMDGYTILHISDIRERLFGAEGEEIAEVLLKKCGFDPQGRMTDCGMLIFDREKQDVNAGGSGCGCSATVTASYFYPKLRSGEIRDMLLIGTGALLSPRTVLQKESIPSVAHLVHLRRTQK